MKRIFGLVLFHTCHILLELDSRKCVWETRAKAEEEERHLAQENAQKSLDIFNLCMLVKAPTFVCPDFFFGQFFYWCSSFVCKRHDFTDFNLDIFQCFAGAAGLFMIAFLFVVTNKSIKREKPRSRDVTKKGKRLARKYRKMSLHSWLVGVRRHKSSLLCYPALVFKHWKTSPISRLSSMFFNGRRTRQCFHKAA